MNANEKPSGEGWAILPAKRSKGFEIPYPPGVREPQHTGRNCSFVFADREPEVCAECARIVAESK